MSRVSETAWPVIVVGAPSSDPSADWTQFSTSLERALSDSGLGRVLERADEAREVAIELANWDYGLELVDGLVERAGLPPRCSVIPTRWLEFQCTEYFESEYAERGSMDASGDAIVRPRGLISEDRALDMLVIGGPGIGVSWGYRRGVSGIWVWYPIDARFALVAPGVRSLVESWTDGTLSV